MKDFNEIYGPGSDDYGRSPSPWKRNDMKVEMEVCSYCGERTNVPVNQDVDLRENYVEGAGQLCGECYNKVYNKLP
jgi:hypothetical protein